MCKLKQKQSTIFLFSNADKLRICHFSCPILMPPQSAPPRISLLGAQVLRGTVDRFAFVQSSVEEEGSHETIFVYSSEFIEDTAKQ